MLNSVLLLTRCTRAPIERCSSPVEVVLTGSKAALPGLIEILGVSTGDTALLTKANTIITVEGSRLQPGDAIDMSQPTHALGTSHTRVSGDRVEPDEQMNNRQEPSTEVLADLL